MNKVILKGRLTKDPEVRYSTNGNNTALCNFNIAVERRFKKEGEDRQADFPNCKAFGKTAEFIGKYFSKGGEIVIEGRLQTGSYDDKEGKKVYTTDVMVEQVEFCGSKNNFGNSAGSNNSNTGSDGIEPLEDEDLPF